MRKELAYLLGYFYADGYLLDVKHKYPILEIVKSDSENILICLNKLNIKYTVSYRFRKNSKNEQVCIRISSKDSNIDLFRCALEDKIKMNNILNTINNFNLSYFLRGFFDGDGCINISKNNHSRLYFYGSFEQEWDLIFNIFKNLNIKYTYQQIIRKDGKHKSSHICISNKWGINLFYEYLYPNREFDFGLLRKYEKLNSVKSMIKRKHIIPYNDNKEIESLKTYT